MILSKNPRLFKAKVPATDTGRQGKATITGAKTFALIVLSGFALLSAVYVWLYYPVDMAFPYTPLTVWTTVALGVNTFVWRPAFKTVPPVGRQTRRALWGGIAALFGGTTALLCWAFWKVADETVAPPLAISEPFRGTTIAMEDGRFYQHNGLDFVGIHRALRANLAAGRVVQGGSTITQQLAKNLFLSNDRTLWRKAKEACLAVALERKFSKAQILTLYVATIDYGMGQHGIRQAAQFYFHKAPEQLTLAESAVLVGLVPSPPHTWLTQEQLEKGRKTALDRVAFFFPDRYTAREIEAARATPLEDIVVPFVGPERRGATAKLPSTLQGVRMFFYTAPDVAQEIPHVNPILRERFRTFLGEARTRYGVVGVDHVGCYVDRPMRGLTATPSAHAYGQAIDLSGFRFADGTRVSVAEHQEKAASARLRSLLTLLQRHFDRVLYWENEPKRHQEHFHAEVFAVRPLLSARTVPPGLAAEEGNPDHD